MTTLTINNLHVAIEDKEILKGFNLTINTGEIHAIMRPTNREIHSSCSDNGTPFVRNLKGNLVR